MITAGQAKKCTKKSLNEQVKNFPLNFPHLMAYIEEKIKVAVLDGAYETVLVFTSSLHTKECLIKYLHSKGYRTKFNSFQNDERSYTLSWE